MSTQKVLKHGPRLRHAALRQVLQQRFDERCRRNPAYSRRAFARDLGASAATVTEYMAGRRAISLKLARQWTARLALSDREVEPILGAGFERLEPDSALRQELMRHWHYFPILTLVEIEDGPSVEVVAERLGLRIGVARKAVDVLCDLGMLQRDESGALHATGKSYSAASFTKATKPKAGTLQRFALVDQMLRRFSRQSLEERRRTYECSDFSTGVFGVDMTRIVEIKRRIAKFRRDLMAFAEGGDATEVFQLTVGLIPLTKNARAPAQLSLDHPAQRYLDV